MPLKEDKDLWDLPLRAVKHSWARRPTGVNAAPHLASFIPKRSPQLPLGGRGGSFRAGKACWQFNAPFYQGAGTAQVLIHKTTQKYKCLKGRDCVLWSVGDWPKAQFPWPLWGSAGIASRLVLVLGSFSVRAKSSRLGRRSRAAHLPSKTGLANHSYLRSQVSRFTFDSSTTWGPLCEKKHPLTRHIRKATLAYPKGGERDPPGTGAKDP